MADRIATAPGKRVVADAAQNGTAFIFEPMQTGFSAMITVMSSRESSGIVFRAVYPDAGFMIGSDSSQDRGEVTLFG